MPLGPGHALRSSPPEHVPDVIADAAVLTRVPAGPAAEAQRHSDGDRTAGLTGRSVPASWRSG